MSVLDPKKTLKNLRKKGFVDSFNHSKDHKYLELFHNNKLVCYTKISHGNKDIGDPLIKQMSFQCKLDKDEFMDLAKCPMSEEEYIELLENKGYLK